MVWYQTFIGAGNGQFIIRCAKHTQATCIGIEIEASRCEETRALIDQELKASMLVSQHDDDNHCDYHLHDNNDNNQNDDDDGDHHQQHHHHSSSIRSTNIVSAYHRCHIICCNALEYNNYRNGTCFFLYLVPRGLRLILPHLLTIPHKIRVITYMSPLPSTFQRNKNRNNRYSNRKIDDNDNESRRSDENNISNHSHESSVTIGADIKEDGIHEINPVDVDNNQQYPLHHQMHAVSQHDFNDDKDRNNIHGFTPHDEGINDNDGDDDQTVTKVKEEDDDIIIIKPLNIYRVATASHPDALWPLYYYELDLKPHHLS